MKFIPSHPIGISGTALQLGFECQKNESLWHNINLITGFGFPFSFFLVNTDLQDPDRAETRVGVLQMEASTTVLR